MNRRQDLTDKRPGKAANGGIEKTLADLRKSEAEKQAILNGLKGLVRVRYMTPDLKIIWSNADDVEEPMVEEGGGMLN